MGVPAVKGEQAETRAKRRKHAKSHGMEYDCAAGHRRASEIEWDVGRNGLISIRDVHHSGSGYFPCWLQGMCVGFSMWVENWLVRK